MFDFYVKILIYIFALAMSLYGLSAFDFNRFLKKNTGYNGMVLYVIVALIMAYLLGEFIISITYYFNM